MKRTPLLILGLLFLSLSVACLFNPDHSSRLHLALVVELIFFIQFAMAKKLRMAIKIPESIVSSQPLQRQDKENVVVDMSEAEVLESPAVMEVNS
jgi:hypothetical protein